MFGISELLENLGKVSKVDIEKNVLLFIILCMQSKMHKIMIRSTHVHCTVHFVFRPRSNIDTDKSAA